MFIKDYLPFYHRNLKIAIPIIMSSMGVTFVQIIDTLMVGRLGTVELAAVAFSTSIFYLGSLFVSGLLMGGTPIIGQLFARGENEKISGFFANMVYMSVYASVVIGVLLYIVRHFMPYMGQEPSVVVFAKQYFLILILSLLPNSLFLVFKQWLEGLGNTAVAMIITIISNIINIILNYLLIYGKFGFPELGVVGAGIATLISRIMLVVMFVIYLCFVKRWRIYHQNIFSNLFCVQKQKEFFKVGMPIAVHTLLEVSAFSLSGIMMGWISATAMASHQICSNISMISFTILLGIANATTIRVSHQYGARDFHSMKMAANASVHLCLLVTVVMGVMFCVLRFPLMHLFSVDENVIMIGADILIAVGIYQIFDGMQVVGAGILRGIKDVKITMYVAFFSYIVINLPLGYILAFVFDFGPIGIWAGFIGGLSTAALLFRMRYVKDFKKIDNGIYIDDVANNMTAD
ncbi:MAG: MATE family efflux transporter [Candidatus Aphodosoma sp.]